jgi:hypothetical protein
MSSGFDHETFRFVRQCLNRVRDRMSSTEHVYVTHLIGMSALCNRRELKATWPAVRKDFILRPAFRRNVFLEVFVAT